MPNSIVLVLQMREDAGVEDTSPDGEYDDRDYDSTFDYDSEDSDVTTGWDSQDNSFSSDEGMLATEWYTQQQRHKTRVHRTHVHPLRKAMVPQNPLL